MNSAYRFALKIIDFVLKETRLVRHTIYRHANDDGYRIESMYKNGTVEWVLSRFESNKWIKYPVMDYVTFVSCVDELGMHMNSPCDLVQVDSYVCAHERWERHEDNSVIIQIVRPHEIEHALKVDIHSEGLSEELNVLYARLDPKLSLNQPEP